MKLRFNLSFLLCLGLLVIFLIYIITQVNISQISQIIRSSQFNYLLLALLASLGMIVSQGYFLKKVFSLADISLSFTNALTTWLIIIASGVFSIGLSGPVLIFALLKKNKNTTVSAKVTILFYFFYILPIALFILLTVGLYLQYRLENQTIIIILLFLFMIIIGLFSIKYFAGKVLAKFWPDYFLNDQFRLLSLLNWRQIGSTMIISSFELIFNLLIFVFVILALKIQLNLPSIFQNLAIVELVSLISPSGSGIGFVEISLGSSLALSHLSSFQAVTVVALYRLFSFWLPFLLGALALIYSWPKIVKLVIKH